MIQDLVTTTKNPRIVAIHLGRIVRHLDDAFFESLRIDPEALPPDVITSLRDAIHATWAAAQAVAEEPINTPKKAKKAKADKPAKELIILAPTLVAAEAVEAPTEVITDEDDLAPGPYDHIQERFDNA